MIHFSFDFDEGTDSDDRSRIRLALHMFGWAPTGQSNWRYPAPGNGDQNLDLLNKVVPALNYVRTLIAAKKIMVGEMTLDIIAHSAYSSKTGCGFPISSAEDLLLESCAEWNSPKLSQSRLRKHLSRAELDLA